MNYGGNSSYSMGNALHNTSFSSQGSALSYSTGYSSQLPHQSLVPGSTPTGYNVMHHQSSNTGSTSANNTGRSGFWVKLPYVLFYHLWILLNYFSLVMDEHAVESPNVYAEFTVVRYVWGEPAVVNTMHVSVIRLNYTFDIIAALRWLVAFIDLHTLSVSFHCG